MIGTMNPQADMRISASGDSALNVRFGERIDESVSARVLAFDRAVHAAHIDGVVETVPAYASVLVHYDCRRIGFAALKRALAMLAPASEAAVAAGRRWIVPVVYGEASGPDLEKVAADLGLSSEVVAERHLASAFRIAMLGFTPGFAYLTGLDGGLHLPRKEVPIPRAEAGTVSIAAGQAAIQSLAGPTGWHVIGRTPVRNFQPGRDPVFLFEPGDLITFERIDAAAYAGLERMAEEGATVARLAP